MVRLLEVSNTNFISCMGRLLITQHQINKYNYGNSICTTNNLAAYLSEAHHVLFNIVCRMKRTVYKAAAT